MEFMHFDASLVAVAGAPDDEKFDYEGTTQTLESQDESNSGSVTKNNKNSASRKKKKK
jgi:hypothetical protein